MDSVFEPAYKLPGGQDAVLPQNRGIFYDNHFHPPHGGYGALTNPATQAPLGEAAIADSADVDAAVKSAHAAFASWRYEKPMARAALLRQLAARIRENAELLGYLDALNGGNPIREMINDAKAAATAIEYAAGLVLEIKGETIPMGPGALNYSTREPLGVVARIVAYNHPLMFLAAKLAPALAAGNTVILKPPVQAPLSGFKLAELIADIFPPGVVNIVTGGLECGQALVAHPLVKKVTLIGSTATGAAILRNAADKIMPVQLELGGKNPLIICPDADLDAAIDGVVAGMNFTWAGQSCGSTSRCFVYRSLYDTVLAELPKRIAARHLCGLPEKLDTTMGCMIDETQHEKVLGFIADTQADGARLICGGKRPEDPALAKGWFVEPTVFADVTPAMRLFREEVFGPVLAVIPWEDEAQLLAQVNDCDYGLTGSIWTRDLKRAHRMAAQIESGYIWINHTGSHFLGAEFGGYKRSGMGREEGLSELLSFTQTKNVYVAL